MNILIVDDQDQNLSLLMRIVERMGFDTATIFTAKNGEEGLRMYHVHTPRIIISDKEMPVMDGMTFIQRIAELPENSTVKKVILMSAAGFTEREKSLGFAAGVSNFMSKPIKIAELENLLRKYLPK